MTICKTVHRSPSIFVPVPHTVSRATWECHAFDTLSQTASRFMCGWEGKNGAALDEFDTAAAAAFARAARMRLRSVSKRPGDVACPP